MYVKIVLIGTDYLSIYFNYTLTFSFFQGFFLISDKKMPCESISQSIKPHAGRLFYAQAVAVVAHFYKSGMFGFDNIRSVESEIQFSVRFKKHSVTAVVYH